MIALVYKSGGDFDIRYVEALVYQLREYGKYRGSICCLTDCPNAVAQLRDPIPIQLHYGWPGWWSKIELFRPGLFDSDVLYLDLDTLVMHNINELMKALDRVSRAIPVFLRGNHSKARAHNWMASGMMFWRGDQLTHLFDSFIQANPNQVIREQAQLPKEAGQRGDQGFIRRAIQTSYTFFQDIPLPEDYIMFKKNITRDGMELLFCHILCWSG